MTSPDVVEGFGRGEDRTFEEPWQAQAFALAVQLHAQGAFTWAEWACALAERLSAAGHQTSQAAYYEAWLAALETLAAAKGLTSAAELATRKSTWTQAYLNTPHGSPVELAAGS